MFSPLHKKELRWPSFSSYSFSILVAPTKIWPRNFKPSITLNLEGAIWTVIELQRWGFWISTSPNRLILRNNLKRKLKNTKAWHELIFSINSRVLWNFCTNFSRIREHRIGNRDKNNESHKLTQERRQTKNELNPTASKSLHKERTNPRFFIRPWKNREK